MTQPADPVFEVCARQKSIPAAMQRLEESISGVAGMVELLARELAGVLQTEPASAEQEGNTKEAICRFGTNLSEQIHRIDRLESEIKGIIDRLEI